MNIAGLRSARGYLGTDAVPQEALSQALRIPDLMRLCKICVYGNSHSSLTSKGFGSPWKTHTAMSSGGVPLRQ